MATTICLLTGCHREPPLHLPSDAKPMVNLDLTVQLTADVLFEAGWEALWTYGWDDTDSLLWGKLGYTKPTIFDIRRYFLGQVPGSPHHRPDEFNYNPGHLRDYFPFGYYDLLAWNSLGRDPYVIIDESDYEQVRAYTNASSRVASRNTMFTRAYNQPEELFAGYELDLYVSPYLEDYEYYDEETNTYFMHAHLYLHPVTYIYLIQVRLHNNHGRVSGTSGETDLSGMARGVTLNNGIADEETVKVSYGSRIKSKLTIQSTGEVVDVIGGRCLTFGIPGQNSATISRSESSTTSQHSISVPMQFYTGTDTTMVFDVSDQIHNNPQGGVITIDLDVDSIPIPTRAGGSGMDAVVEDFEKKDFHINI